MARRKTNSGKANHIKLDTVLDLRAAAPLAEQFGELRGGDIVVEAADVERVGALCVQVLLSAKTTWDAAGDCFDLEKPSEPFLNGLEALGLNQSHFEKAQESS